MNKHYVRTYKEESSYWSGQHRDTVFLEGFYVKLYCTLVDGSKKIAWFKDKIDAIAYGQMKAHCLCVDFHQDIPEEKTKKKKRGK